MNQKEEIKKEKKLVSDAIKKHLSNYDGAISSIELNSIDMPRVRLLNSMMIENIFNERKESYYNSEFKKLCTALKNSALKLGRLAFEYQYEYLKNSTTPVFNNRFNRDEFISAFNLVLKELYTTNNG